MQGRCTVSVRAGKRRLRDRRDLPQCEANANVYTLQEAEGRSIAQTVFVQLAVDLPRGEDFGRLVFQGVKVDSGLYFADEGFVGLPESACKGLPVSPHFR